MRGGWNQGPNLAETDAQITEFTPCVHDDRISVFKERATLIGTDLERAPASCRQF